jgi:molecular chaperone GrpE
MPPGEQDGSPQDAETLANGTASEGESAKAEQAADAGMLDDPEALRAELERLRAEGEEYLDGWQRARAEFANYRKRVERESQESYKRAAGDILCRYLPVLDDLELALRERPTEGDAAAWAHGITIIHQKLLSLLESEGIERIPAEGQTFDPNFHEALSQEESADYKEGQIIDVIRQGYKLDDRVLRPALVRVAK